MPARKVEPPAPAPVYPNDRGLRACRWGSDVNWWSGLVDLSDPRAVRAAFLLLARYADAGDQALADRKHRPGGEH